MVLSLYPPDSPRLKQDRIHEAERYNTSLKNKSDKTVNVINIHNPSIEVHLVGDARPTPARPSSSLQAAGIPSCGSGRKAADFVPFFKKHGVSTIILRYRLRIDGYDAEDRRRERRFSSHPPGARSRGGMEIRP